MSLRILPPERAREKARAKVAEFQRKKAKADLEAKGKLGGEHAAVKPAEKAVPSVEPNVGAGAKASAQEKKAELNRLFLEAVGENKITMVRRLLKAGADVDARETSATHRFGGGDVSTGWTALMIAVGNRKMELAQVLVDEGADVNAKENRGRTVLDVAEEFGFGFQEPVDFLVSKGAKRAEELK